MKNDEFDEFARVGVLGFWGFAMITMFFIKNKFGVAEADIFKWKVNEVLNKKYVSKYICKQQEI